MKYSFGKRIISVILVVATILTSTGFSTFATSISSVVNSNLTTLYESENDKVSKYYYEYLEESKTYLMTDDSNSNYYSEENTLHDLENTSPVLGDNSIDEGAVDNPKVSNENLDNINSVDTNDDTYISIDAEEEPEEEPEEAPEEAPLSNVENNEEENADISSSTAVESDVIEESSVNQSEIIESESETNESMNISVSSESSIAEEESLEVSTTSFVEEEINVSTTSSVIDGVLTATWSDSYYVVIYDGNDANDNIKMDNQYVAFDTETKLNPNVYRKSGYTFKGWRHKDDIYNDAADIINLASPSDNIVILKAIWERNGYRLTIKDGDDTIDSFDIEADNNFDLSDLGLEKDGYTLRGFADSRYGEVVYGPNAIIFSDIVLKDNITLYARWVKTEDINVVIDIDGNGGYINGEENYIINSDYTDFLYNPNGHRDGYIYRGLVDGEGNPFVFDRRQQGYRSMRLTAVWEKINEPILYISNDGKERYATDKTYDKNENIGSIKSPYDLGFDGNGHTFLYWSDKIDGDGNIYNVGDSYDTIVDTDSLYHGLYAIWDDIKLSDIIKVERPKDLTLEQNLVSKDINNATNSFATEGKQKNKFNIVDNNYFGSPGGYIALGEFHVGTISMYNGSTSVQDMRDIGYTKPHYRHEGWAYQQWWKDNTYYIITDSRPPVSQFQWTVRQQVPGVPGWEDYLIEDNPVVGVLEPYFIGNLYRIQIDASGGYFESDIHDYNMQLDSTNAMATFHAARYGDPAYLIAIPKRVGYTFVNYVTTDGNHLHRYLDYAEDDVNVIPTDIYYGETRYILNLTTDWEANHYTIFFDGSGANGSMEPIDMTYDVSRNLPENQFNKEGYDFAGWLYNGTIYGDTVNVSNLATLSDAKLVFKALWQKKTYQINYHGNGNTNTSAIMTSEVVNYDELHKLKQNIFTKTGYNFNGWSLSTHSESIYNDEAYIGFASDSMREVIDLYATWIKTTLIRGTIHINGNGGYVNGSTTYEKSYMEGEDIEAFSFYREGYVSGRLTRGGIDYELPDMCDFYGNINLDVTWGRKISYNVRYHSNDENKLVLTDASLYEYNDTVIIRGANTFTRNHYTLVGFATSSESKNIAYNFGESLSNLTLKDGDIVDLYAVWEGAHYTINVIDDVSGIYDNDKGTPSVTTVAVYDCTYGEDFQLPRTIRNTRRYITGTTSIVTTYGFATEPNSYTVAFQGGVRADDIYLAYSGASSINIYVAMDYFRDMMATYRSDPNINMYAVLPNGGTVQGQPRVLMPNRKFTSHKEPFRYFDNGVTEGMLYYREHVEHVTRPILDHRKGYTLLGFVDGHGNPIDFNTYTTASYSDAYMAEIEATWKEERYNLAYKKEPGLAGTMATRYNIMHEDQFRLADIGYTKEGFDFAGWDTSPDANKVVYLNRATVSGLGDIDEMVYLYPVWEEKSYNIIYEESGVVVATDTILHTEAKRLKTNASVKDGHVDRGYIYNGATGIKTFKSAELVTVDRFDLAEDVKDIVLVGTGRKNNYNVTLDATEGIFDDGTKRKQLGLKYNDYLITLEAPSRHGYKFEGYYATYNNIFMPLLDRCTYEDDFTAVASWSAINYKIHFDVYGGSTYLDDMDMTYNVERNLPDYTGTKAGFVFTGWIGSRSEFGRTDPVSNLTSIDGDIITLRARWERPTYTITFNANGGTGNMHGETATFSVPHTIAANTFTRTGFEFEGFALSPDSEVIVADGGEILLDIEYTPSITLYAIWKENSSDNPIVATLYIRGGGGLVNGVDEYVMHLHKDDIIIEPSVMREGYTFSRWGYNGGIFTFGKLCDFEGTRTITAEWNTKVSKIIYHSNNDHDDIREYTYNESISLSVLNNIFGWTKTGYTFDHWSTDYLTEGEVYYPYDDISLTSGQEINLYARWNPKAITISYEGGTDATGDMTSDTFVYGEDAHLSANRFEREDYIFTGWATSSTSRRIAYINQDSVDKLMRENENRTTYTLYAVWTERSQTINVMYHGQGGYFGTHYDTYLLQARYGDSFTKLSATYKGHVQGEYENENHAFILEGTRIYIATNAYATWIENTYTLIYDANGGAPSDAMPDETHLYTDEYRLTSIAYNKDAYEFIGWSENHSTNSVRYIDRATVSRLIESGSKTLYAAWRGRSYNIRFNKVDPLTTGAIPNVSFNYGDTIHLVGKVFTRQGLKQIAWSYIDGEGQISTYSVAGAIDTSKFDVSASGIVDLYAVYSTGASTVILNPNGGQFAGYDPGAMKQIVVYQDDYTSQFEHPMNKGYKFADYYVEDNGIYDVLHDRWDYIGDKELIASWSGISYKVRFLDNGATSGHHMPDQDMVYGTIATLNHVLYTKSGYDFTGWNFNGNILSDQARVATLTNIDGEIVYLSAEWEGLNYTISYDGNGAVGVMPDVTAHYGEAKKLDRNAFVRDGYEFIGWSLSRNGSVAYQNEAYYGMNGESYSSEVTLYARWKSSSEIDAYLVLHGTGGTFNGADIATLSFSLNEKIIIPEVSRVGYTLSGWQARNGSGFTPYIIPERCSFTGTRHLYASWSDILYNVVFHSNNGKHEISSISDVRYNDTIQLNDPSANWQKTGYHFVSWRVAAEGNSTDYPVGNIILGNIINQENIEGTTINLYAHRERIRYVFNYVDDRGVDIADQETYYGDSDVLLGDPYYLIDDASNYRSYVFLGWSQSDDGVPTYLPNDSCDSIISAYDNLRMEDNVDTVHITLTGVWTQKGNTVVVAYDPNGGYIAERRDIYHVNVEIGSGFRKYFAYREGYTQEDYQNVNGNEILEGTIINVATTAIVEWSYATYSIIYDGRGGIPYNAMRVHELVSHNYFDVFNLPENDYTKEAYRFGGWTYNPLSKIVDLADTEEVSRLTKDDKISIYAVWDPGQYSIRYNIADGDSGVVPETPFTYGERVLTTDQTFSKAGSSQIGWRYTDINGREHTYGIHTYVDSSDFTVIEGETHIDFYAIYDESPYEVTLDAASGEFADGSTIKVERVKYNSETDTFAIPNRLGYRFDGYDVTDNGITSRLHPIWDYLGNRTAVASWSGIRYYINFDSNGGIGTRMNQEEFVYDIDKRLLENTYTRPGYTFNGWTMDGGRKFIDRATISNLTTIPDTEIVFNADWEGLNYNVIYNGNGATNIDAMSSEIATYGMTHRLKANEFVRDGYIFEGWTRRSTDSLVTYYDEGKIPADVPYESNYNLYAKWEEDTNVTSRLIVHGNLGTFRGAPIATINLTYGANIDISHLAPERLGYDNIGWQVPSGTTWTRYVVPSICRFYGDKHIYAAWDEKTYTFRYHSNNGDGDIITTTNAFAGNERMSNPWTYVGHDFESFGLSESGDTERFAIDVDVNVSDIVRAAIDEGRITEKDLSIDLYARWSPKTITINFVGGVGAVGSMLEQVATYGSNEPLRSNIFTRNEYTFTGWATNSTTMRLAYIDKTPVEKVIEGAGNNVSVTLYAIWVSDSDKVLLTYDYTGGNVGIYDKSKVYVERGSTFKYVSAKREGYNQEDYENIDRTKFIEDVTVINVATTAFATWDYKSYRVIYDGKGGTPSDIMDDESRVSHPYFATFSLANNMYHKAGYEFNGWSRSSRGREADYINGEEVSKLTEDDVITLYAVWEGKTYTIHFNSVLPNARGVIPDTTFTYGTKKLLDGSCYVVPGMVQKGWKYVDGNGVEHGYNLTDNIDTSDFTVSLTGADVIELNAYYESNPYIARLNANGGRYSDGRERKEIKVHYGEVLSFEVPSRDGYKFTNYEVYNQGVHEGTLHNTWDYLGDRDLVASWSGIEYTVEFNANGGEGHMDRQTGFVYGTETPLSANTFVKEGYKFKNWIAEDGRKIFDKATVSDLTIVDGALVTLVAEWEGLNYTINYNSNGSDSGNMPSETATYGTNHQLSENRYAKINHTFKGWALTSLGSVEYYDKATISDTDYINPFNLYAKWIYDEDIAARIVLHGNGGTFNGLPEVTLLLSENEPIIIPELKRPGYTFNNRWTEGSVEGPDYTMPDTASRLTETLHLYAKWDDSLDKNTYSIVYHSNNGENELLTISDLSYDTNVELRSNLWTKTGFIMDYWADKPQGYTNNQYREHTSIQVSRLISDMGIVGNVIDLYARYRGKSLTIHFDKNNADALGVMKDQIATYSDGIGRQLNSNAFTLKGYSFGGWSTTSTARSCRYIDCDYVNYVIEENINATNITLYAIWVNNADRVDVKYDPVGGEIAGRPYVYTLPVTRGSGFAKVRAIRTGYNQGEYENVHHEYIYEGDIINTATTAYATWPTKKQYRIIYNSMGADNPTAMDEYSEVYHDYDATFNLDSNLYTRSGYEFNGWAFDPSSKEPDYGNAASVTKLTENSSVVLYALWKGKEYTIRYNPSIDDTTGEVPDTTFRYGERASISTATFLHSRYTQVGWSYRRADGTEYRFGLIRQVDSSNFEISDTTTYIDLYALYKDTKANITAYVDANGGKFADGYTHKEYRMKNDQIITFPEPERVGYRFVDYYVNGEVLDDTWTYYNTDETVVASWAAIEYSINYDGNGATRLADVSVQKARYDEEVKLIENHYERTGYIFDGWISDSGDTYADKATVSNLTIVDGRSVTLMARWKPRTYKIRYHFVAEAEDRLPAINYTFVEDNISFAEAHVLDPVNNSQLPANIRGALAGRQIVGWANGKGKTISYANGVTYGEREAYMSEIDLYAVFRMSDIREILLINLSGNGGQVYGSENTVEIQYKLGEIMQEPIAYRKGYELAGWENLYFTPMGGQWRNYYFGNLCDTANLLSVVRAKWTPKTYNIIYDSNDSTGRVSTQSTLAGSDDILASIMWDKPGYTFSGWSTTRNGSEHVFDVGSRCEDTTEALYNDVTNEIKLYAVWTAKTMQVRYNSNGGVGTMQDQTLKFGESEYLCENAFTKSNYVFVGWAGTENGSIRYYDKENADTVILNENSVGLTLYAIWEESEDVVTTVYKGNKGKVNGRNTYIRTSTDDKFTEIIPEREGYIYNGYVNKDGVPFTSDTTIDVATIAYASWSTTKYRVYYDGNGARRGSVVDNNEHEYNDRFELESNTFVRIGYEFKGWNTDKNATQVLYKDREPVKGLTKDTSITLYAIWQKYVVNYPSLVSAHTGSLFGAAPQMVNGDLYGTGDQISDLTGNFPFAAESPTIDDVTSWSAEELVKANYEHIGWKYTRSDGRTIYVHRGQEVVITEELYDEFETYNPDTYEWYGFHDLDVWWLGVLTSPVYLNSTEGIFADGETSHITSIRYGDSTSIFDVPIRDGYDFAGYKLNDGIIGSTWLYEGLEGMRVTLDASWEPYNYTVNYITNDSSIVINPEIATYGEYYKISDREMLRDGFNFDGWRQAGTNNIYQPGDEVINLTTIKDAVVTLIAEWTPLTYTINYHANGGEGSMASDIATYSVAFILSQNTFTRNGYEFNGWALDEYTDAIYGDEERIGGGTNTAYTARLDLYATWLDPDAVQGTLVLDGNGGFVNGRPVFRKSFRNRETVYIESIIAERTGYHFIRWATTSEVGVTTELIIPSECTWSGELRGFAEWGDPIKYNVVYHANDGTGRTESDTNIDYDADYHIKDETVFNRDGYRLIGWALSTTDTRVAYEPGITTSNLSSTEGESVHLYAVWSANTYTIVYNSNNAMAVYSLATFSYTYGKGEYIVDNPASLASFSMFGDRFIGWASRSVAGSHDIDYYGGTSADEVYDSLGRPSVFTLYAIWLTSDDYSVDITFDARGGKINGRDKLIATLRYGSSIVYPRAIKRGYYYDNWLTTSSVIFNEPFVNFYDNIELHVDWIEGNYNIAFIGQDATGTMSGNIGMDIMQSVPYTREVPLTDNDYIRTGYDFKGWDTSEDARSVIYINKASVSRLGDNGETVRLYPVWDEKSYNIEYRENGELIATDRLVHFGNGRVKSPMRQDRPGEKYYYTSKESGAREWIAGEIYDISDFTLAEGSNTITFELKSKPTAYQAIFKLEKGSFPDGTTIKRVIATYNEPLNYPETPIYGERTFNGWKRLDNGAIYNSLIYEFGGDMTFVGDWNLYSFNVVFDKNAPISISGEANVVTGTMATQSFTEGVTEKLRVNTFKLSGYEFIGWATRSYTAIDAEIIKDDISRKHLIIKDEKELTFTEGVNDTITLYAMWTRKRIEVKISQNESYASVNDPYAGSVIIIYDTSLSDYNEFTKVVTRQGYKPFTGKFTKVPISDPYDRSNYSGVEGVDYLTTRSILRDANITKLYPLWENEEYRVKIDIRDGYWVNQYATTSVTMYYDAPYFVKGSNGEPRNRDGSLVTPMSPKNRTTFYSWSIDYEGRNVINGKDLYLDTTIDTIYANYMNRGERVKPGDGNNNGGGGSGGTIDVSMHEATFVLHNMLPYNQNESSWTYDPLSDTWGYKISVNTDIAKALINDKNGRDRFRYVDNNESLQLLDGVYQINNLGNYNYFAFDKNGNMQTGFMKTTNGTRHYELDEGTLSLVAKAYVDEAVYYLIEKTNFKGMIWNIPTIINKVLNIFDEQGRLIDTYSEIFGTSGDMVAHTMGAESIGGNSMIVYDLSSESFVSVVLNNNNGKHYVNQGIYMENIFK